MTCARSIGTLIEYGVASRPAAGQTVSGDLHLIAHFDHGVFLAVVDGVGHGDEAVLASSTAITLLKRKADAPLITLVQQCHKVLAGTRGAVMTVARLDAQERTLTWLGIGNVEGRLLHGESHPDHPCESVLLRGGVVGGQLPALQPSVLPLAAGDLLIFATDGIHAGFGDGMNTLETPQRLAERILKKNFKGNDDALVLTVRYLGARDG